MRSTPLYNGCVDYLKVVDPHEVYSPVQGVSCAVLDRPHQRGLEGPRGGFCISGLSSCTGQRGMAGGTWRGYALCWGPVSSAGTTLGLPAPRPEAASVGP